VKECALLSEEGGKFARLNFRPCREFIDYKTSMITDENPLWGCCSARISVSFTHWTSLGLSALASPGSMVMM
jgi:hypothetical protein